MIASKIRQELQKALEDEKARLEKELASFADRDTKPAGDFDTRPPDFGGNTADRDMEADISESEEYEKLVAIEHALELRHKEVTEALGRIEHEGYGICANCKNPIPMERLRANPAATTCLKC